jgi:uncharacterized protein YgiM (DUF1202 family)
MRHIAVVATVLVALAACSEKAAPEPTAPTPPTAAEPSEPAEPAAEPEQAYLTYVTGIRRKPSDAKKVEVEGKTKKVHNWLSTLYRGEEVTVLEVQGDWARVVASDETEGWVKKTGLLPTEGVSLATLFEKTKTFHRPDLLAQNTSRSIEPATLLFVLKTKNQFTEVNYYGQGSVWVLSDKLSVDPTEISAAKLLAKVQWLKGRKDPDADKVMELARTHFGETKLVAMANDDGAVASEEEVAVEEEASGETGEATPE